jgi:hypothetical protein
MIIVAFERHLIGKDRHVERRWKVNDQDVTSRLIPKTWTTDS